MPTKITIETDGRPEPVVLENIIQFAIVGQHAITLEPQNGDGTSAAIPMPFTHGVLGGHPGCHNQLIGLCSQLVEDLRCERERSAKAKRPLIQRPNIPPPSDLRNLKFPGSG